MTKQMEQVDGVLRRLLSDEKRATTLMGRDEIRFLVGTYYDMQHNRIRSDGQVRALTKDDKPNAVLEWLAATNTTLEKQIAVALDVWTMNDPVAKWARSHMGVGPVIAAGLCAHIDFAKCPTPGHIYSFAGLVNGQVWGKGERRPWNADLKKLCFLLGESFVKVHNQPDDIYGKFYKDRKVLEAARNAEGLFADQAKATLESKNFNKDTDAYAAYIAGRLPQARIHARARRYAVKMFLSHLQHVGWVALHGEAPAKPYAIAHLGHAHFIAPAYGPKWDASWGTQLTL